MQEDNFVNVEIADRVYKVRVRKEDEELFLNAVEAITTNVKDYAKKYAYKDKQDLLAMVLLQYVTSYMKSNDKDVCNSEEVFKYLERINSALDNK
ncbi:MAG: cell division protein ZapA [Bacteroidales bacterium]|jgi:hypothetical protein|nr:cell division protein ZapA [Bacteroidales bacterium]